MTKYELLSQELDVTFTVAELEYIKEIMREQEESHIASDICIKAAQVISELYAAVERQERQAREDEMVREFGRQYTASLFCYRGNINYEYEDEATFRAKSEDEAMDIAKQTFAAKIAKNPHHYIIIKETRPF